jgi:hypothetical protein
MTAPLAGCHVGTAGGFGAEVRPLTIWRGNRRLARS